MPFDISLRVVSIEARTRAACPYGIANALVIGGGGIPGWVRRAVPLPASQEGSSELGFVGLLIS